MNMKVEVQMDTRLLINGEFADGTETPEAILNPRTGETILALPEASMDQVDAAVAGARDALAGRVPHRQSDRPHYSGSQTGSSKRARLSAGLRR